MSASEKRSDSVCLAQRENDGTNVELWFDFHAEEVRVHVRRTSHGSAEFTLYPPNAVALDCYYHPFAYADRVLTRGTFAQSAVQ